MGAKVTALLEQGWRPEGLGRRAWPLSRLRSSGVVAGGGGWRQWSEDAQLPLGPPGSGRD